MLSGQFFFRDEPLFFQVRCQTADKLDAVDNRIQVLTLCIAALLEVAEVDVRHIARVGGTQGYLARAVARMRFEYRPSQIVEVLGYQRRIAGKITAKHTQQGETEQIGERALRRGSLDYRQARSVGHIYSCASACPLLIHWIASTVFGALEHSPVIEVHTVDDADFVTILQVLADAGQFRSHLDPIALQDVSRPDPGEHQELRGVERAPRKNHVARRINLVPLAVILTRIAVRTVKLLAVEIFYSVGPVSAVNQYARYQRVQFDLQVVRILLRGFDEPLARADSLMIPRRQRRISNTHCVVAHQLPVIGIALPLD